MRQVFLFIGRCSLVVMTALMMTGCTIYQSIAKSPGTFFNAPSGYQFSHLGNAQWNSSENALVYFYRPHSEWGDDELESPSVYVDDIQYFNFRAGSFTWLEMAPGTRKIDLRRPFFGLEAIGPIVLSHFVDYSMNVKPGEIYYFRYSEETPPPEVNDKIAPDSPLGQGDMQLVSHDTAMKEIMDTRFLDSDDFSPNHAGLNISERNKLTNMKIALDALYKQKEFEEEKLKTEGKGPKWWWPFGGEPVSPTLLSKIEEGEKQYDEYEDVVADVESKRFSDRGLWAGTKQRMSRDINYELRLNKSGFSFGTHVPEGAIEESDKKEVTSEEKK